MDAPDRGHLEHLAVSQCDERVRVKLLEVVTLQVDQQQVGQAVESLWADELYVVLVHVESLQTVQAFECLFVDPFHFIKGHLQDLWQQYWKFVRGKQKWL